MIVSLSFKGGNILSLSVVAKINVCFLKLNSKVISFHSNLFFDSFSVLKIVKNAIVKSWGKAWHSSNKIVISLSAMSGKKICSKNCSLFLIVEQLSSTKDLLSPRLLYKFFANAFANSVLPKPFAPIRLRKGQTPVLLNASR